MEGDQKKLVILDGDEEDKAEAHRRDNRKRDYFQEYIKYNKAVHPSQWNLDTRTTVPKRKSRRISSTAAKPYYSSILLPEYSHIPVPEILSFLISCRDPNCKCRNSKDGSQSTAPIDIQDDGSKLIDFMGLSTSNKPQCPSWKKSHKEGSPESLIKQEVSEPFQHLSADVRNVAAKRSTDVLNLELTLYCGKKPCK